MNQDKPASLAKLCSHCGLRPRWRRSSRCESCKKLYDKSFYQDHQPAKIESAVKRKHDLLDWYRELKHQKPCRDCGAVLHYCQLDFDHLPQYQKRFEVSQMVRLGYEKEKIVEEVRKCELVCKNCHALRTWRRLRGQKGSTYGE